MTVRRPFIFALSVTTATLGIAACDIGVNIGALPETASTGSSDERPQSTDGGALETLASGIEGLYTIAYADGWIYFSTTYHVTGPDEAATSDIWRLPLSGGTPVLLVQDTPRVSPQGFVASATSLYWAGVDGVVRTAPVEGGAPMTLYQTPPAGPYNFVSLTIDAASVYWGDMGGAIHSMPLAGGEVTTVVAPTPDTTIVSLAVDPTHVYWLEAGDFATHVRKVPLAGGTPTTLMDGTTHSMKITVHDDSLYLTDAGATFGYASDGSVLGQGSVFKMRTDQTTSPEILATNQGFPSAISADASGVYWGGGSAFADTRSGVPINRMGAGANAIEPLTKSAVIWSMTSCSGGVCWLDLSTNSIVRYAEPQP